MKLVNSRVPLNSYVYIHWILDFKYILVLLLLFVLPQIAYVLIYVLISISV